MSGIGRAAVPPTPPGLFAYGSGRQPVPQPLRVALIFVRVLFGLTVLGGAGVLMTAASVDAVDGQLLGLLAYAAAPGVVGLVLSRWAWTGGAWVRWGLLAVQGWLLVGALRTLGDGGGRGLTQLVLPLAVIVLLCRRPSRAWFLLAPFDRAEHRPFRLARMIKWRTDGGQTAAEYLGLVVVVVAVVGGLVATGVGGQITGGLRAAICELSGSACPAAGPNGGGGGAGGDEGGGTNTEAGGGPGSGESGGAGNPGGDGSAGGEVRAAEEKRGDAEGGKKDGGNDAKEDESCSGWAIVSCGVKQVGGFFKGAAADGFWGDVTGTFDTVMHPLDALDGIKEYGKSLGDRWSDDSKGAGDKWDKGNYLGAVWDWGKASGKTVVNVADDVFVGDEVRDMWDKGEYGRAVGTVGWNVGSLFIPGYGEAKLIGRIGKLGKGAKLGKVGELAEKASEAAAKARKAGEAGDIDGARKAAEEAREHADAAAEEAGTNGCTIGMGGRIRTPYRGSVGVPGAGIGAVAVARAAVPVGLLTAGKCGEDVDPEKAAAAKRADTEADEAERAAQNARQKQREWDTIPQVVGPAAGKTLKPPHPRHTVAGAKHGKVSEKNTIILKGNEKAVDDDIKGIAEGKADLLDDKNTYEVNGRRYRVESNGRTYPVSGKGLVEMDRNEYAALKEIARAGGRTDSPALTRDPRFTEHPEAVEKAKNVYDGTYQ
ncbi:hypothetical protein ACFXKG_39170 [Streptomyces sp. NPDC059255]|uniref:hypothetical protein n=1 Tax=Streptomyces sp. NPDC059255 TaxID=3346793 RepID=UPI0036993AD5